MVSLLGDEDENVRGSAASALDPRLRPSDQGTLQISSRVVPTLNNLLEDEREVEYPIAGLRHKVKDVAWWLLQQYSEETGQRIYRDEGRE